MAGIQRGAEKLKVLRLPPENLITGDSFQRDALPKPEARQASLFILALIPVLVLGILLRFYSLNADPDWRLDWNPGLLTDEAFYMHNARNEVLFGNARLDEFNNMVLSPIIHWIHVQVFERFGVGYPQGRAVSVVFSLLSLAIFYRLLLLISRAIQSKYLPCFLFPLTAVCWLAYEHTYLLFNRMALLEAPLAFFCLLSLWSFAESTQASRVSSQWFWGLVCGAGAVLALATKTTATTYVVALLGCSLYFGGVSFFRGRRQSLPRGSRSKWVPAAPILAGFLMALTFWFFLWLLPNWTEFSHMQRYYLNRQGRAESLWGLWLSIQRALIGERYGMSQFFALHLPFVWGFNLLLFAALMVRRSLRASLTPVEWVLVLWVAFSWLQMASIRIAPTRYTAAFLPAMIALLIIAFIRWDEVREFMRMGGWRAWLARTVILAWMIYFAMMRLLPSVEWRGIEFPIFNTEIQVRMLLTAVILGGGVSYWLSRWLKRGSEGQDTGNMPLKPAFLLLVSVFVILNTHWYVQYFGNRTFQMEAWNKVLAQTLPPDSVIVGIAFETPFRYFFVFNGLCNWREPLTERGATHMMLIGSDETLFRFWTNSGSLEKWYSQYSDLGFGTRFKAQGRIGPYKIRLYHLPEQTAPTQSSANAVIVN